MYLKHLLSLSLLGTQNPKPNFQISLFYPKIVLHLSLAQVFSVARIFLLIFKIQLQCPPDQNLSILTQL